MKIADEEYNESQQALIHDLVSALLSDQIIQRQKAREQLVEIGGPAVDYLARSFKTRNKALRWEIMKTLVQIADKRSLHLFINSLEDKNTDIRWLAAEGLIKLGHISLKPLLKDLIERPNSIFLKEGVHHVLHDVIRKSDLQETFTPILAELKETDDDEKVAVLAWTLLKNLEGRI